MLIERVGRYSDGTVKLNEDDLLNSRHLPVMLIMNMVGEGRFLSVIETLSKDNGFGEEYGACTLPNDLDEFDKANGEELNGAEFALYRGSYYWFSDAILLFENFMW